MPTETFFKDIYIDDAAADILIAGLEQPREPYVPKTNVYEELKKGKEWLRQMELRKKLKSCDDSKEEASAVINDKLLTHAEEREIEIKTEIAKNGIREGLSTELLTKLTGLDTEIIEHIRTVSQNNA